jgi:hypothetical protein
MVSNIVYAALIKHLTEKRLYHIIAIAALGITDTDSTDGEVLKWGIA